ncbi:hypothetical protein U9M48_005202 [Paspalum notatum var. saurae]|uniref:F-box domain-containing protein n=1 Tax=Paspalum notatum var. saurae TaxID=547442 RepID=A0AAQ3PX07_PASNO
MPPVRRARGAHAAAASSYLTVADGWLSRRRRTVSVGNKRRAGAESDDGAPTPAILVPDDVLFSIFSRASGAADVARCAASICRALPAPAPTAASIPHLALGVLFPQRKTAREGARLRFLPTAAAAAAFANSARRHLAGLSAGGPLDLDFDHARPVASRNGHVVLELRRAGGLTLCVWNPVTGAVSVLPPLSGKDYPGDYACAILTSHDVADGPLASLPGFFRVLVVYERRRSSRSFTALRCYSSDTGSWAAEAKKPGAKISGRVLRQLRPAVVRRGVAYWSTHRAAFGVRLDGATSATMDVLWVPYDLKQIRLDNHMVGVSPDGRLRLIETGFVALKLRVIDFVTSELKDHQIDDDDIKIPVPEIRLTSTLTPAVKLRWFGEKSGTLIVTVEETSGSTSAVYAFNLATRSVEKLADGVSNHAYRNMFGYEMIAQHNLCP